MGMKNLKNFYLTLCAMLQKPKEALENLRKKLMCEEKFYIEYYHPKEILNFGLSPVWFMQWA